VIAAEPINCHGFEPPQVHLVTLLVRAAGLGGVALDRFSRSGFQVTGRGSRPVPLSGDARPRFSRRALCCGTRPVTVTHTHRPMSVFSRGGRPSRDMWSLGVCCQVISVHSAFSPSDLHLLWLQAWREMTAAMKQGKQVASLLWPGGESCWCVWLYQSVCQSVRLPVLLSVCPYCCVSACQSCQSVRTVVRVSAYLPARTVGCLFVCLPARLPVCLGLGLWLSACLPVCAPPQIAKSTT
jgi:hypothetical protein